MVPYYYKALINPQGEVATVRFFYKFNARGAANENGFGLSILTDPANVSSISGLNHTQQYLTLDPKGFESGSSTELSLVFQDLVNNKMPSFNTLPGISPNLDNYDSVEVNFTNGIAQNTLNTVNPYLIIDQTRGREIHAINYAPTFNMNEELLGTGLDASLPGIDQYYKTAEGLPWVLMVPGEFYYPYEQVDIITAYTKFEDWAESGGTLFQDWYDYTNPAYIDDTKIYLLNED